MKRNIYRPIMILQRCCKLARSRSCIRYTLPHLSHLRLAAKPFLNGIGLLFLSLVMLCIFSAPARAAEATLEFVSVAQVQPMGVGASQTLTYEVRNNVPTAPVPITNVILSPTSSIDEITGWTTDCNQLVPAGGTCNIQVVLTGNQEGSVNQNLQILYSDRNVILQTPITVSVGAGLVFSQQPTSAQDMLTRSTQVLTYVVTNNSTITPIVLNSFSFIPSSTSDNAIISNDCNRQVAPQGICTIKVIIVTTNTPSTGPITQSLQIVYTDGSVQPTLTSNSVSFTVTANPVTLAFTHVPSTISDMNPNGTQYLLYVIGNTSHVTVPITPAVTPSTGGATDSATINDSCGGVVPAATSSGAGSCSLLVKLTAGGTTGSVIQNFQVGYGSGQLLSSPISFDITNTAVSSISFVSPQPIAQDLNNTAQGGGTTSQNLIYQVNNAGATPVTISGLAVSPSPLDTIGTILVGPVTGESCSSTCSATNLPANCACQVTVPINAGATNGTVNQTFSVTTTNGDPLVLNSDPIIFAISDQNTRNFTFVNKCSFPVWMGGTGGGEAACSTASDPLPQGNCALPNETCVLVPPTQSNPNPTNGTCYFNPPNLLGSDAYELAAASGPAGSVGGVGTLAVPITTNAIDGIQNIFWSGIFAGRTGCTTSGCQIADCSGSGQVDGTGSCLVGQGFSQPAIQFEPTLANQTGPAAAASINYDNYDITMINGISVPLSAAPLNPGMPNTNGFICGSPGSTTGNSSQGIGGCWADVTPPNNDIFDYAKVAAGGAACTTQSDCTSTPGNVCGLAFNSNNTFTHACGPIIGYWSADQVCSITPNSPTAPAAFNCNQSLQSGTINEPWLSGVNRHTGYKTTDLYACAPITTSANQSGPPSLNPPQATTPLTIPSGYTQGTVDNSVCGCVDWNTVGVNVGTAATPCVASTDAWISLVLPQVQWMKTACPSSYVFPYDDSTSSQVCGTIASVDDAGVNQENYVVTFCPDGLTGGLTN